jgi:predicted PurR-regulated permease PerM
VDRLPSYWERIQKPLLKLEHKASISGQRAKQQAANEANLEEGTNQPPAGTDPNGKPQANGQESGVQNGFSQIFGGITKALKTLASNAATFLMIGITVFVGVIFTLLNPKPMIGFFFALIPAQHHGKALVIGKRIAEIVPRWALATILGMTIIGAMVFLAMWPILGFSDAVVLGLIALVLEAVPYVGPMLAVLPAILLAVGKGGLTPVWVLAAYAVIQTIENNVIAPVIVAGRLNLNPVAAIFSIVLCVTTFGVLGVLIAVPMVAIVNILHEELYRPRFLPDVSDADLDRLAQETLSRSKPPRPRRKIFRFRHKEKAPTGNGH